MDEVIRLSLFSITTVLDGGFFDYNKIQFAGAHRPLYLIRKGKLIKTKGDCMPIGRYLNNNPFTLHEIELNKNDQLYLCTDGFVDQYSKLQNKKYLEKKFKEFLLKISTESITSEKYSRKRIKYVEIGCRTN